MPSHERWRLRAFISIAIYPAICSYDEQALDSMSEESENNNFIVKELFQLVLSQGMVEQAKKRWRLQTPVINVSC